MSVYISNVANTINENGRYVATYTLLFNETITEQDSLLSWLKLESIKYSLDDDEDAIVVINDNNIEIKGDILNIIIEVFDLDLNLKDDEVIEDDMTFLVELD